MISLHWCSVVNDPRLAIATCMVDLRLAIEMPDDPGIQRKMGAAHRSPDHERNDGDDGCDDDVPKRKAKTTKSSASSSKSSGDNDSDIVSEESSAESE